MYINKAVIIFLAVLILSSCSSSRFPGVHRITVQQGNVISQVMIDKLKVGMTKSQVRYILGNTMVEDTFGENRWDYIYYAQVPRMDDVRKTLHLYFANGRLSHFDGDYKATKEETAEETVEETAEATKDKAKQTAANSEA